LEWWRDRSNSWSGICFKIEGELRSEV
jgi:hypothetical protein